MTNATHLAHWRGLRARCLALTFILAILGTVPLYGAEGARPGSADRCSGVDCASRPVRGVTVYRGLVLDYEVIDGLAVHGGDMVLGTAEEAAAAAPSREPAKREAREAPPGPVRRDLFPTKNSWLWPGGRVPYVIHEDLEGEDLEVIHAAIEVWNTKTVIDWIPRTDEWEYALFGPRDSGPCRSGVGRGSPTRMSIEGCDLGAMIHEMGHAMGLWHEHQRADRDEFLQLGPDRFGLIYNRGYTVDQVFWIKPEEPADTYDHQSIMHYPLGGFSLQTIPPGFVPRWADGYLSAGDIDGVARLYGKPPGTITVSTSPSGLGVIVDGKFVPTPAMFDWLPDSVHTLEAPLVQHPVWYAAEKQLVFGRWSNGGGRKQTVRADPDSTWFTANYIALHEVSPNPYSQAFKHRVALSQGTTDGLVVFNNQVKYTPIATGLKRDEFARWMLGGSVFLPQRTLPGNAVRAFIEIHPTAPAAHFGIPPFYRIRSNIEGMLLPVSVAGRDYIAPAAFQPSELPSGSKVSVPEVVPVYGDFGRGGRYRFIGWSDGGEREHEIEVPAGGGSLTFQMQREFQLGTDHIDSEGEIVVSPESEDGFYPAGSQVQLTAVPAAGYHFLGWGNDVSGTETTQFVIMDRDRRAAPTFVRAEPEPILVQFGEPLQVDSLAHGRHYVRVPDGTSQVAVRFEASAPTRDAGLQVSINGDALASTRLRESDTITLTRDAFFRMRARSRATTGGGGRGNREHLRIRSRGGVGSGKLHVSIQRDWIAHVWPRAFTLVSQVGWPRPVWQPMRFVPVEGVPPRVRYRIVSNQHWLEAVPPEWTSAEGEVEIAVRANGAALAAEAYSGKLQILTVSDGDPPAGGTPTGIEIPVHFVVKPWDGVEKPWNGYEGPTEDERAAATEIAAGAAVRGQLERVGDADWFRFRTTAAQTSVTAYTVSEGDTVGELHAAGMAVVTDEDSGSGGNFRIVANVPAGTHYLRVSGFGVADYTLRLEAVPNDHTLELEAGYPMEFVWVPAGNFLMRSPAVEDYAGPNYRDDWHREVRISQGFLMGKYEVTQGEWEAVMGENPSHFTECGSRCPVEQVSWDDVQEFIRRLNEREFGSGYVYRLPTEAEWEYAARARTTGARHGELDVVAWYSENSNRTTHPVGQKWANAWGLHDMLGNVREWTADWYGKYPSGAVADPQGPDTGSYRVTRGGSWLHFANMVRSAYRDYYSPGTRYSSIGFRLVRTE